MANKATLTVADTLPKSFVLSCTTRGDKPAMREKLYGIWNAISWAQWLERARDVTYALHAIGFRPGDDSMLLLSALFGAGAVGAQHGDDLAARHREADAANRHDRAVVALDVGDLEDVVAHSCSAQAPR